MVMSVLDGQYLIDQDTHLPLETNSHAGSFHPSAHQLLLFPFSEQLITAITIVVQ